MVTVCVCTQMASAHLSLASLTFSDLASVRLFSISPRLFVQPPWKSSPSTPPAPAPADSLSRCFALLIFTWLARPHLPGLNSNIVFSEKLPSNLAQSRPLPPTRLCYINLVPSPFIALTTLGTYLVFADCCCWLVDYQGFSRETDL